MTNTTATRNQVDLITAAISALNASTDNHPYSGLMVELTDEGVRVFDDYAGCLINVEESLKALKACDPIDWSDPAGTEDGFQSVWDCMVEA